MARALPAPDIPQNLDDLTPTWLTAALRSTGVITEAAVVSARAEILGEGEGFVGQIARLHLDFDRPAPGAPATIIAKLPTTIELNRALGEMLGAYEREIRFYQELAGTVALKTARMYYAAMDPNPVEGREAQALRFVNAIPTWLLRILMPLLLWIGERTKRRYVLLLEDLREARVGDQVAGCTLSEAQEMARLIAWNQAALWNHPALEDRYWLAGFDLTPALTHLIFRRNRRSLDDSFGEHIRDPRGAIPVLLDWLDRNGERVLHHLGSKPHTVIHGDFRLDNLFFRDEPTELTSRVIAIDWQGVGYGRGPYDLAYFLTGNLDADVLASSERALLEDYHGGLCAGGVSDYDFDSCWNDYQIAKLFLLYRLVSGSGMIDLSHERGQQILARTFAGIEGTLPTEDLDSLLGAV